MSIRTTLDIPEPLYMALRRIAESADTSVQSLIVRAIEQVYLEPKRGECLAGPLVTGPGKLGLHSRRTRIPVTSFFPDLTVCSLVRVRHHHNAEVWRSIASMP